MEFHEKLQELRRRRGMTQEELAQALYVSRTAISKWESGRGYPSIDCLRSIARFFWVTVDELLSSDQVLALAEDDGRKKGKHLRALACGMLDVSMVLLLLLPLFAKRTEMTVQAVSLIELDGVLPCLKISYFAVVLIMVAIGPWTLALQNCHASFWLKIQTAASLSLGAFAVLLFTVTLHPYAAIFAFVLLAIKTLFLSFMR